MIKTKLAASRAGRPKGAEDRGVTRVAEDAAGRARRRSAGRRGVRGVRGVFADTAGAPFAETISNPTTGQKLLWDQHPDFAGFGIVVGTRTRTWVVKHRWRDADGAAKVRQFAIGPAGPGGLSLAEARVKAAAWRRWWIDHPGDDPRAAEREAREARRRAELTLRDAAAAYVAARIEAGRSPRSMASYQRSFELYLAEWLDKPLRSIGAGEVLERFRKIAAGEDLGARSDGGKFAPRGSAELKGGGRTARLTFAAFKAVHRWARKRLDQTLGEPPTGAIDDLSAVTRSDRIVAASALPAVAAAAAVWPNAVQADLFTFLLHTGLRLGEASALRWSEVDLEAGAIAIEAGRMKARRKLAIPIGPTALAALARRRAAGIDAAGFVFVGGCRGCGACAGRGGHASLSSKFLAALVAAAGAPFSAHDIRRTFTSAALDAGVSVHVVEVLTAHVHSGVTLGHYYAPSPTTLRDAVARIDAEIVGRCAAGR